MFLKPFSNSYITGGNENVDGNYSGRNHVEHFLNRYSEIFDSVLQYVNNYTFVENESKMKENLKDANHLLKLATNIIKRLNNILSNQTNTKNINVFKGIIPFKNERSNIVLNAAEDLETAYKYAKSDLERKHKEHNKILKNFYINMENAEKYLFLGLEKIKYIGNEILKYQTI